MMSDKTKWTFFPGGPRTTGELTEKDRATWIRERADAYDKNALVPGAPLPAPKTESGKPPLIEGGRYKDPVSKVDLGAATAMGKATEEYEQNFGAHRQQGQQTPPPPGAPQQPAWAAGAGRSMNGKPIYPTPKGWFYLNPDGSQGAGVQ